MKTIIISNGFHNFPLRFVAEGFYKKDFKVILLTGIYPYNKLIKIIKIFKLDKFEVIQRILNRKISLPDKYVHSFYLSELFYQIGRKIYNRFEIFKRIYKFMDYYAGKFYQISANNFLKKLSPNNKYIYVCRCGYGGNSLRDIKNIKTFVVHNNVHPKIQKTAILNKGIITKDSKFNDEVDGLFAHMTNDLDKAKNILTSGDQAIYANKLYFKNKNKKFYQIYDQIPNHYLQYLKNTKINKKYLKNSKLKVCYLGSLVERKGAEVILEIMKNYDNKKIELTIMCNAFDFKYKEEIIKTIKKRKINLLYNAKFKTIAKKLVENHIFLFPSYSEGLARAPLEALACGNYLFVSKIFTDFSNRNIGVTFLDQTKPKVWVNALNKIINNPKKINNSFKKNHKIAIKEYSQKSYLNVYLKHFNL
jgi:glycosyltransferase involved in cell wall biosynthesis